MSKGGGMPDPAAWAGRAQTRDPLEISREAVSEWLRRVEGARDAMMRSGLPVGEEAAELDLACEDLRASWAAFDGYMSLLLTRIGDDPLAKIPLAAMVAMYIQGIGAAGVASKYCSLPTMIDIRALNKLKAKRARSGVSNIIEARREILRPHIHRLYRNNGEAEPERRVLLTAADRALAAVRAELVAQLSQEGTTDEKAVRKAVRTAGAAKVSDDTLASDIDALRGEQAACSSPR